MSESPILEYWPEGIAAARIPANNNVRLLQALLLNPAISASTSAQPGSPSEGDVYILPASPTGSNWAGFFEDDVVIFYNDTWTAYTPPEGLLKFVEDEGEEWQFVGSSAGGWAVFNGGGGGGSVDSVNGQTGVVVLDAGDVGAATAAQGSTADSAVQPGDLATIATTGALLDATDFPGGTTDFLRADGSFATPSGGGGLTNWTEAVNTSAPNATIPVVSFTASNAATHVDAAIIPKGANGALLAEIPDNTAAGGNKRGDYAVDWQRTRGSAAAVASGIGSVIGGGENNTASGVYSTVAGGIQNAASGIRTFTSGSGNTASGSYATAIGRDNNASSTYCVALGYNNAPSASAAICLGSSNIVSGADGASAIGSTCSALAQYSHAKGYLASTRAVIGAHTYASGQLSALGDAQRGEYVLRSDTNSATPEVMTTNNGAGGTNNQVILPNSSAFTVSGTIVARESGGNARAWTVDAFIVRGANAAATTLITGGTPAIKGTSGAFTGTLAITADTTNGGMAITVTGVAATNIKWVAVLQTSEVTG